MKKFILEKSPLNDSSIAADTKKDQVFIQIVFLPTYLPYWISMLSSTFSTTFKHRLICFRLFISRRIRILELSYLDIIDLNTSIVQTDRNHGWMLRMNMDRHDPTFCLINEFRKRRIFQGEQDNHSRALM